MIYTPDQIRALTPYRRTVELRGQPPELRDLLLCHAWDDRRGVATELNDLLEADHFLSRRQVSIWAITCADVAPGLWCGVEGRSSSPSSPNRRWRLTHLLAHAREIPISAATWAIGRV